MTDVHSIEKTYTITEYLTQEDAAGVRHEFHNGTLTEMAGGILPHNVIKGELYTLINLAIRNAKIPHMVLNSDTKVRIEAQNRFVYPDLTISDGQPRYYRDPEGNIRRDILANPLLIAEVLSAETRSFDQSEKFDLYCSIPGFREYLLIEPESIWIKSFYLQDPERGLWHIRILTDPQATLRLESLDLEIPVADLYQVLEKLPKE